MVEKKIIVVEDDIDIREIVIYALEAAGFECVGFEEGRELYEELGKEDRLPSLILLDIMLPSDDGLTILKALRRDERYADIPVIMLTAKGSEADKVRGLNTGADDYITKPFAVTELLARINAVLRRSKKAEVETDELVYKDIVLDKKRYKVKVGEEEVVFTYKEFELLSYLLMNKGIVLTRDKLMSAVWGDDYVGESRTIDMHIKSLRKKLGVAGECVVTVRNVGYKLGE